MMVIPWLIVCGIIRNRWCFKTLSPHSVRWDGALFVAHFINMD